jgi:hypothetical protein
LQTWYYGKLALPAIALICVATIGWYQWRSGSEQPKSNNNIAHAKEAPGSMNNQTGGDLYKTQEEGSDPISTLQKNYAQQVALPVQRVRPTAPKVNQLPAWYSKNKVPVAAIKFDSDRGVEYINPISGNKVRIKPNTLVYADGLPVQGEVDMFFREYRDIPDMLSANIPMHFNANDGNDYFFNTGGMFDVRVSQNGQELFVAEGEAFDVVFDATNNLTNASLFYLDEQRNNWDYVSNRAFAEPGMNRFDARTVTNREAAPPISTETTVLKENRGNASCPPQEPVFSKGHNAVAVVKQAIKTGVQLTTGKYKLPVWFKNNPTAGDNYFTYAFDRSEIKLVYANDDDEVRFFPQDVKGVCNEFDAFRDYYFVRIGDSSSSVVSTVDPIFNHTSIWSSFTVVPFTEDPTKFIVTLGYENEGFIRVNAKLVKTNDFKKTVTTDAIGIYQKYYDLREKRLNGLMAELIKLRQFVQGSKVFHEKGQEYCMSERDWLTWFDQNIPKMRARYMQLEKQGYATDDALAQQALTNWEGVVRQERLAIADRMRAIKLSEGQALTALLSLFKFGAYNCDQIYRFSKNPIYRSAQFIDDNGQPIIAKQMSMLEKSTKTFLTMNMTDKIVLMPGRKMEIVITDARNRIYLINSDTYNKTIVKERAMYTLTAKDVTDSAQTPKGWADVLGM